MNKLDQFGKDSLTIAKACCAVIYLTCLAAFGMCVLSALFR